MRGAPIAALILLTGCKLVDQRTFNPDAGRPPTLPKAPVTLPQPDRTLGGLPPLVTIRFGQDTAYDPAVIQATRAALHQKPDARFTILTAVPPGAADAQAAAAATVGPVAAHVAQLIERQGVPASRVVLEARPEAKLSAIELRVYVH